MFFILVCQKWNSAMEFLWNREFNMIEENYSPRPNCAEEISLTEFCAILKRIGGQLKHFCIEFTDNYWKERTLVGYFRNSRNFLFSCKWEENEIRRILEILSEECHNLISIKIDYIKFEKIFVDPNHREQSRLKVL